MVLCWPYLVYCRSLFRMCSVRVFLPILLYSTVVCIVHFTVWRVGLDSLARHSVWSRQPWSPLLHSTTPPVGYHTWPTYVLRYSVFYVIVSCCLPISWWMAVATYPEYFQYFQGFPLSDRLAAPTLVCTSRLGCGRVALQYCCSPDPLKVCIGYTC